jgi:nitroimidazol reductase NimA-like FMN-containing flavoprotein (pyridoxamine 5'-phosphate oxidase superfamily)
MPSRRDQIKMSPAEVDEFLAGRRTMNVATNGPSGYPHVVAMWYGFVDRKPAFWTFGRSQKIVNLRRDDRLSALIEDGDTYEMLRGVELVGRGRIVDDRDASSKSDSPWRSAIKERVAMPPVRSSKPKRRSDSAS